MDNDIDNITEEPNEIKKKGGRSFKKAAIVLALALLASIAGLYYIFKESDTAKTGLKSANSQIAELQKDVNSLRTQVDTLKASLRREKDARTQLQFENDTLKTMLPIYIDKIEVANADGHGSIISRWDKDISAASSMYLMPRITYLGLKTGVKLELMVRLYDHDGKLVTGNTSPKGFSYGYKIDPVMPGINTVSLSGWGGGDRGHFKPGTYRYEVWFGDMCLKQKEFVLK